ncbi:MAG: hypothetical protein ABI383_00230 [Acidobacteriaceae bacterium]
MKMQIARLCQATAFTLLACGVLSAVGMAQTDDNGQRVSPRFVVLPKKELAPNVKQPAGQLQVWNGTFNHQGTNYSYQMVGADPSTNTSALIPTFVIPVSMTISGTNFSPLNGGSSSALARTVLSPVFDLTTDYKQGGVDLGHTQYVDAFQRGNFWSIVRNNPRSHTLLGGPTAHVTVLPTLTLTVPPQDGFIGHPFGPAAGEVDINYFDAQINAYMSAHPAITPATFPIFIVNDVYLTEGGCCIGGYHSATGSQSYAMFDYDDHPGVFSQDVSALSHEVAEWMDDPLLNGGNNTPCGILEVGDPLEGTANYGGFPYVLHGFTYNLQDEVFIGYFGAPLSTSVNSWYSFQNYPFSSICQNGS